jgi:hypothetical protein
MLRDVAGSKVRAISEEIYGEGWEERRLINDNAEGD